MPSAGPSGDAARGREARRVAVVHEWISARAGGEKVFEAIAGCFPDADLWALTADPGVRLQLGGRKVRTTFLDRLGPLRERRGLTLPLMPLAWSSLRVSPAYDLVISSHLACAHGFRPGRDAVHLSYVHSPARYIWLPELDDRGSRLPIASLARSALRRWDRRASRHVDSYAANSREVAQRIARFWGRDARVIHPPVETDFYTPDPSPSAPNERGYLLGVSRLIPYKRLDAVLLTAELLQLPAVIVGGGPEAPRLRQLAAGLNVPVTFTGAVDDQELRRLYRGARALVFPANEDFGIVPVEAQACGTPVVAVDQGGSRDTVSNGVSGVLVPTADPADLAAGVERAVATIMPEACRSWALRFSPDRFRRELLAWVDDAAPLDRRS